MNLLSKVSGILIVGTLFFFGLSVFYGGINNAPKQVLNLLATLESKILKHRHTLAPPNTDFERELRNILTPGVMGYAWASSNSSRVVVNGAYGYARSPYETENPSRLFTPDTPINIASVSKPVCAVAIMRLLELTPYNITTKFYDLIKSRLDGPVGNGVADVRLMDLLQQRSGLVNHATLNDDDLWPFLNTYLKQDRINPIGTYSYSNANFAILAGVVEAVTGIDYGTFVTNYVLRPMDINIGEFMYIPLPPSIATLSYSDYTDTRTGTYWPQMKHSLAPGGWIASANQLLNFLLGVRYNKVLTPESTHLMFAENLGWYPINGAHGVYYWHNGAMPVRRQQGIHTGIISFGDTGYDVVLLINSISESPPQILAGIFDSDP